MKNLATCTLLALTAGAAYALAQDAPPTPEPIPVVRAAARWDYRVVGLTELHAGALDTARDILEGAKDASDLLDFGKKADEALVAKTEKVLDEMGDEGWELVVYSGNVLIFKKPR